MPYFQNPFDQEFRGSLILGDRQYTSNFIIAGNLNSSKLMMAWVPGPYNMSTNNTLTIHYAVDPTLKQFQTMAINVAGATPSATQAWEVVNALNSNANFSSLWVANYRPLNDDPQVNTVYMQSKRPNLGIRAYIDNTGAEKVMKFNTKAPIAQLPTYFARHTIANALTFSDSLATLVQLNPGDSYTASMITAAGQDPTTVLDDWQLLYGRSGIFNFKKQVYDGSSRLTSILEYPAGARVGDLAKLTEYQYEGADTVASIVTEVPYTLTSGDLVTPP